MDAAVVAAADELLLQLLVDALRVCDARSEQRSGREDNAAQRPDEAHGRCAYQARAFSVNALHSVAMVNAGTQAVLITGASSGIGAALAREYDKRGARVALLARRTDKLAEVARKVPGAVPIACDVTDDASVQRAVREALAAFGDLDVVVANAGIGIMGSVEELSIDDYRRQFETNVFGVLRTAKASLGTLKRTSGRHRARRQRVGVSVAAGDERVRDEQVRGSGARRSARRRARVRRACP